ncbi:unnamed protein product [Arctia plantaginis]|uniref:Uncharacterized protein n=1 Tax=Arctia plantaginis TaxID=874455 RepID=A0A8S1A7H6_ARCPL|nr:unnamed protein product [Arctia plantaginis]
MDHLEGKMGTDKIGPSSPVPSSSTEKPEHNELTVSFPPLEDLYSNTPEKHFGTENNTVVTSQTGSTALLPCVIRNIGDGIHLARGGILEALIRVASVVGGKPLTHLKSARAELIPSYILALSGVRVESREISLGGK